MAAAYILVWDWLTCVVDGEVVRQVGGQRAAEGGGQVGDTHGDKHQAQHRLQQARQAQGRRGVSYRGRVRYMLRGFVVENA